MGLLDQLRNLYHQKTRQGWQLQEIAEKSGVHKATIIRIMKDDTRNPGLQTVETLMATLKGLGTRV